MLAVLASVEMYEHVQPPPQLNYKFLELRVPADGQCFWSCLWLSQEARTEEMVAWFVRPRNSQGFALGVVQKRESQVVSRWALQLENMPDATRARLKQKQSAEDEDLET